MIKFVLILKTKVSIIILCKVTIFYLFLLINNFYLTFFLIFCDIYALFKIMAIN